MQAFLLVLLLVLIDFVTLSISTDTERGAPLPQRWDIAPLFCIGVLVGLCGLAELLGILYIALNYMSYSAGSPELYSFAFEVILFSCCFNVFVVRELHVSMWCAPRPTVGLLVFTAADTVIAVVLATVGAPNFAPIPLWHSVVILAWVFVFGVAVNDAVKLAAMRYVVPHLPSVAGACSMRVRGGWGGRGPCGCARA